jgi:hypothetical protein
VICHGKKQGPPGRSRDNMWGLQPWNGGQRGNARGRSSWCGAGPELSRRAGDEKKIKKNKTDE